MEDFELKLKEQNPNINAIEIQSRIREYVLSNLKITVKETSK